MARTAVSFAMRHTGAVTEFPPTANKHDPDPRPVKPEPPLPAECCETGCAVCVWDDYSDRMQEWREKLAAWRERHPEADD